ncbi:MAG: TetR/AcrR family transcriptional regulator [Acidovorax sp.]|uniref:TetR/AcrR family transcriptional regulator n=1 Tax=Acidovorax sp. TaxID=1872122 RepID=UPI002605585C|nr:TetR/AcrR family transcriptional regulator [Acidovorax sp.]MDH4464605.1 TetR/AcrR family transcriptional regulator [Acidovorax sp.]
MTPNLHQIKSAQTRARLLDAAREVLHHKGYGQLSLHEVARVAQMTTGAVQHHFGSKAALMMEVIVHLVDQLDQGNDFWPPAHWTAKRRADHLVRQAWQQLYSQPRFATAWSAYLAARDDAEMTAHIVERRAQLAERLSLRMHQSFPELGAWPDGQARVHLVLTCLRGLGLQAPFAAPAVIEAQLQLLSFTLQSFLQPPETTP